MTSSDAPRSLPIDINDVVRELLWDAIRRGELTHGAITERSGASHSTVSNFLRGRYNLSYRTAQAMLSALNLELRLEIVPIKSEEP